MIGQERMGGEPCCRFFMQRNLLIVENTRTKNDLSLCDVRLSLRTSSALVPKTSLDRVDVFQSNPSEVGCDKLAAILMPG